MFRLFGSVKETNIGTYVINSTQPMRTLANKTGKLNIEEVIRDGQKLEVLDEDALNHISKCFGVEKNNIFYTPQNNHLESKQS